MIVFNFDNRRTKGFVRSLIEMLKIGLPVPDHPTLSRRGKRLNIQLPKTRSKNINLVIDSTGVKVYGDGGWKAYKHGRGKKTKWIKIHIGIDAQTKDMQAVEITDKRVHDSRVVRNLLEQVEGDIVCVIGDEAYDTRKVHKDMEEISPGAKVVIPPRYKLMLYSFR